MNTCIWFILPTVAYAIFELQYFIRRARLLKEIGKLKKEIGMVAIIFACLCAGYHGRCEVVPNTGYVYFTPDYSQSVSYVPRNECKWVKY